MKKATSLIMVVSLVIAGAIGFSPASSAAASAEEIENTPVLAIEANAKEVSYMEISEETEVIVEEIVEVSEETECPEIPEVSVEETEAPVEEIDEIPEESAEPEAIDLEYEFDGSINFVDYDAIFYTPDEMFYQVLELDADAKCAVAQYGEEYYFIVEWNMHEGTGFVHLDHESYEGEEFFICGGDEFRAMIIRSFVAGERMF